MSEPGRAKPPDQHLPEPLILLIRVNSKQAWRRLLSIRDQSWLLVLLITLFLMGYFALAFFLFWKGLHFVGTFPGLGTLLTERLVYLLFAFLFVLLLFSNLVIGYTNLFRNRETSFLLSLPIPSSAVFQWKFIESSILASWAFLFLIAPLLTAYGMTHLVAWHFYLVAPVFILLFIVLPAVAGAWCAVMLARYLDRRGFQIAAVVAGLGLLLLAATALQPAPISDEMLEIRVLEVLDRLLIRTRFAQFPLLPSYWLSASVLNWAEGALATAFFFVLVLASHVLFFGCLAFTSLGRQFYQAVSAVQSRGGLFSSWKRAAAATAAAEVFGYGPGLMESMFQCVPGLAPDTRALMVKDARMFWRDTTQWGQTLVLFGLLGMYIVNLRHFSHQLTHPFWVNLVSLLNLLACSLNLATLTTRFVYPQFSLEGKRCWIVGLAPMGMERLIKTKFWLANTTALGVTVGLMGLSCHMLNVTRERTLFFIGAVSVMSFTLTAMAAGLGALYPNFKEENPSKIVSGFGGTFCLVLSFVYIVISVVLVAVGAPWSYAVHKPMSWVAVCWSLFGIWSLLAGALPLYLGLRQARRFEIQ